LAFSIVIDFLATRNDVSVEDGEFVKGQSDWQHSPLHQGPASRTDQRR
jgi:hypothetical protein